jgi:hypothetical protein
MDKLREYLAKIAAQEAHSENCGEWGFSACDASGGNYDDAYSYGVEDGEIFQARAVLAKLIEETKTDA